MDGVVNDKGVSPNSQPRLLRFMVNGRPCYAMKWRDERTENRREIDYVMREAGTAEPFCFLVDCPLRVPGTPDVVSVESSGRTILRAETTTWDIAVTVWEDGATDDEALVRFCHPDCFPRHGALLVRDLKRMIREYQQGTRACHDLVPSTTLVDPKAMDLGPLERRFDAMESALRQVGAAKTDRPLSVTEDALRQHLVPVIKAFEEGNQRTVTAVTKVVTCGIDKVSPQNAADRAKSVLVWLQRYPGISGLELSAAAMRLARMPYSKIAIALAREHSIHMTREGARKICLRIEEKAGELLFERKDTYARADKAARAAHATSERDAMDRRLDGESEEESES